MPNLVFRFGIPVLLQATLTQTYLCFSQYPYTFFLIRTVHLDNIKVHYLPTNAQVILLKKYENLHLLPNSATYTHQQGH